MTRRHYQMLADFFNRQISAELKCGRVDVAVHNFELANSLTLKLEEDNERFDYKIFRKAVLKDIVNCNTYTNDFLIHIEEIEG